MSNKQRPHSRLRALAAVAVLLGVLSLPMAGEAQDFNFPRLEEKVKSFTVRIDMTIEISFGMNSNEQEDQFLGNIVTPDGLVLFNGSVLAAESGFMMHGFNVKMTPTEISVTTLDGQQYAAEYLGVDRYTNFGFVRITAPEGTKFDAVAFAEQPCKVGDWLALYMLLPDFIDPPLAADIGMVSVLVRSPDSIPLTVGFNSLQVGSVLFDRDLQPVGVLGPLMDPSAAGFDVAAMMETADQFGMPLLGVISGERLNKIIESPPTKGSTDRGWLGISLQALTKDIAGFWDIDAAGGIIVNEVINNSPADKAGIEMGDIITEINGQPIEIDREDKIAIFQRSIADLGPGASVGLSILRLTNGERQPVSMVVTLAQSPLAATDAPEYTNETFELTVRNLVFSDYMLFNVDEETFQGVVVSELKPGGLAYVGGLTIGDVVQRIDNEDVTSIADAEAILEKIEIEQPRELIFFVWRNNKTLFVNVKADWK
jgi:serine protease Do